MPATTAKLTSIVEEYLAGIERPRGDLARGVRLSSMSATRILALK